MKLSQKSWIDEANKYIDIADLLTSMGIYVPDTIRNGGNKKIHCPFGFYHSDGGRDKAMRLYTQHNTVYCFSCSKRYSPVSLAAAAWDCSWNTAAFRLLEDAGFAPKTLKERWDIAVSPISLDVDTIALADALKTYCSAATPNWSSLQYNDQVSLRLSRCLQLLDSVKTEEDALKWLNTCKKVMTAILENT